MTKRLFTILAVLLLATNVLAGDPWKDKPYKQWDEKDVRKILTDSPWTKSVEVANTWGGRGSGTTANPLGESGSAASSDPRDIARAAKPSAGAEPQAAFLIRWASSRTVRRALARAAVLRGASEADVEKLLAQEFPEYVVIVLGPDMTPFERATENDWKEMKQASYFGLKKSKARLSPARIEVQRGPDGKRITAVIFAFTRKTESGQPALAADEKGVEFLCHFGRINLKAGFDLQKMADNQGLDL